MGLHWLRATALKTPMSAYLTLVLCANSTRKHLFLQPSLHRRRVSKVAYPVETHGLYHEVHNSLGPTETDESKPAQASLGPKSPFGGVPFPWVRTGTATAVYSYIRTAVLQLYCFFLFLPSRRFSLSCFVGQHGLDFRKRVS